MKRKYTITEPEVPSKLRKVTADKDGKLSGKTKYEHRLKSKTGGRSPPKTVNSKDKTSDLSITSKNSNLNNDDSNKKRKQGSCMKHKKQDKVHKRVKKPNKWKKSKDKTKDKKDSKSNDDNEKLSESKVILPKSAQDISSNWKQLQKVLNIKPKKHKASSLYKKNKETVAVVTKTENVIKEKPEAEIWFDDVDEVLIEASRVKPVSADTLTDKWDETSNPLVKADSYSGLTKAVAMDCEMVGTGEDGVDSILARVSIVNQYGQCIYDKYVQATDKVTDYRTQFSGIRPSDMETGDEFKSVQNDVHAMIKGRILVGHALHNDLKVLFLDHPHKDIRDTSRYKPFRKLFQGRIPSLKKLSDQVLGVKVQEGEHNSIQDSQAAMRLYTMYRKTWEKDHKLHSKSKKFKKTAEVSQESETINKTIMDSDGE